jgi:hypothetical protein
VEHEKDINYAMTAILPDIDGGYELCPPLLTEAQAIRYLRLDTLKVKSPAKTLKYYRAQGYLKATGIGNVNFYTRVSLDDFLALMTNLTYERRKRRESKSVRTREIEAAPGLSGGLRGRT